MPGIKFGNTKPSATTSSGGCVLRGRMGKSSKSGRRTGSRKRRNAGSANANGAKRRPTAFDKHRRLAHPKILQAIPQQRRPSTAVAAT